MNTCGIPGAIVGHPSMNGGCSRMSGESAQETPKDTAWVGMATRVNLVFEFRLLGSIYLNSI